MKMFNAIIVYDCFVMAESPEAARASLLALIRDGEQPEEPSEQVATEVRKEPEIRDAWRAKGPLVGTDISDADFNKIKGKTSLDVFAMLHKKMPKVDDKNQATNGKAATK